MKKLLGIFVFLVSMSLSGCAVSQPATGHENALPGGTLNAQALNTPINSIQRMESYNFPGYYLRHTNFQIYLRQNDGSDLFKKDASFKKVAGLKDPTLVSYQSYNFPDHYIRHSNFLLRIDPIVSDLDKQDATFQETVQDTTSPITLTVNTAQQGAAIGQSLYGIFFEEINHASDGGLYGELIRNRSFEDNTSSPDSWSLVQTSGGSGSMALDNSSPLNSAQVMSLRLNVNYASGNHTESKIKTVL